MGIIKSKKILIVIPIVLFVAYSFVKPKPKVVKPKIAGTIYVMPKEFLLNLRDGRYVKLSVALQLAPGQSDGATAASGASGTGEAPAGTLPEEPIVREIITNTITNQTGETLISPAGRKVLRSKIAEAIKAQTDDKIETVLFPDLTVQ